MNISRKLLFFIAAIFITALSGCSKGTPSVKIKTGSNLTFFVATDIHYLPKSLTDGGEAFKNFINTGDGKQLDYIDDIVDAFSNDIKKKKPDVLILSGDLTTNGEKAGHEELASKLAKIEALGTSVYVIPGNHDILNPNARSFKESDQYFTPYINDKDFSKIYGDFGYNEAISRDKSTLSYLAAPSEDLWLLMLDTAQYSNNIKNNGPQVDGRITPETIKWIQECSTMAKKKGAKLVAVMHHNLIDHSETVRKGYTLNNNKEALDIFKQCDINLALSGHIHIQDIKSYEDDSKTIYDIATASLGIYPQKYGVLKYSRNSGFDYTTSTVDVEGWAKESGLTDNNLINFKGYSSSFLRARLFSTVYFRLEGTGSYSDDELDAMAKVYEDLNQSYYEGVINPDIENIKKSLGYKLWLNAAPSFMQRYVISISNTSNINNNQLIIP